ncbi:hypothetical protein A3194_14375 [Candidatus Thiodiazotropha endoloripes]|uniref:SctD/MshK family protein n=1 Tax=Candidatus Thiodiazotropha endoloripes TaxID=1818881 RepID=UPI00083DDD1B|nr:EscD/YscD/HrpQ family type III secretion system periplasmic domain-containing protein [Candidatus Thiodiazotropha endoloripes]ODB84942.1 hypothetical protein A3194_14375 [Candidatus Thiodiazotropha endoloripes]
MQSTTAIEMFVLSGEQAGARRILDNNTTFTISGRMDTDVVFRDTTINDEKLNIITKDNNFIIQVLSGDIEIQGNIVKKGDVVKVDEYTKIKIGNTTFSYGRRVDASWKDIVDRVSKLELSSKSNSSMCKRVLNARSYYVISIVFFVCFFVAYLTYRHSNTVEDIQTSELQTIENLLTRNGFDSLSVSQSKSGHLSISGFLMTNKEKSEVEMIIDQQNIPVMFNLSIGDNLAAEVRELYRVNGVEVDAKVLRYGKVIVTTKESNITQLERLKSIAIKEIPSLQELDTEYLTADKKTDILGTEGNFKKIDKRIVMVVNGSPPYIMTHDKSKYYIGALLPSGHKIKSIYDSSVILEKGGKKTTMQF